MVPNHFLKEQMSFMIWQYLGSVQGQRQFSLVGGKIIWVRGLLLWYTITMWLWFGKDHCHRKKVLTRKTRKCVVSCVRVVWGSAVTADVVSFERHITPKWWTIRHCQYCSIAWKWVTKTLQVSNHNYTIFNNKMYLKMQQQPINNHINN